MQKKSCNVTEAEKYILDIPKFTQKNDLTITKEFLKRLGNPSVDKKIIHIAGTNGKGSVCAYLNAVLMEAGFTVAMFTSPHLVSMRERFRINGIVISEEDFVDAYEKVKEEIQKKQLEDGNGYHPSFFEFLFFMGMLIFEKNNTNHKTVDYVILETGMGGRLDATNIIEHPFVCGITKISLDHTEYLGTTLEEIAGEKAGIIKKAVPVAYLDVNPKVSEIIEKKAISMESKAVNLKNQDFRISKIKKKSIDFSIESGYYGYISLTLDTCALYQVQNAALAVKILEIIHEKLGIITREQIVRGIKNMTWKGRMEEILPHIFLDGAHNEDGIQAFLDTVETRKTTTGRAILLFSVVAEKDYTHMIEKIVKSHLFSHIIVTEIKSSRALPMEKLKELFQSYRDVKITFMGDVEEAFRYGLLMKEKKDTFYVAGSLYLVGQIEEICKGKNPRKL